MSQSMIQKLCERYRSKLNYSCKIRVRARQNE